jgi:hemoglobin
MRQTLYEFAGGAPALLALARAHHEQCLADPLLNHPFSHADQNPQHVERLAAYWGEVFGGPRTYSSECGDQAALLTMHAGNGPGMNELGPRFLACFDAAMDDAGLPADPDFRAALHAYMAWAVADVLAHPEFADVPASVGMPHWGWDGSGTMETP